MRLSDGVGLPWWRKGAQNVKPARPPAWH
jgi:hypothetical protein